MFETRVEFGGTLFCALEDFCTAISLQNPTAQHPRALGDLIRSEYHKGFMTSLRVFTAMRKLVSESYDLAMGNRIFILSSKGCYFLFWKEDGFEITLTIPRIQLISFQLFVKATDARMVKSVAGIFWGVRDFVITTSGDTLLNMNEFVGLGWNQAGRDTKVPYWEWLALLRKYSK